jgi:hypothetical protein
VAAAGDLLAKGRRGTAWATSGPGSSSGAGGRRWRALGVKVLDGRGSSSCGLQWWGGSGERRRVRVCDAAGAVFIGVEELAFKRKTTLAGGSSSKDGGVMGESGPRVPEHVTTQQVGLVSRMCCSAWLQWSSRGPVRGAAHTFPACQMAVGVLGIQAPREPYRATRGRWSAGCRRSRARVGKNPADQHRFDRVLLQDFELCKENSRYESCN